MRENMSRLEAYLAGVCMGFGLGVLVGIICALEATK